MCVMCTWEWMCKWEKQHDSGFLTRLPTGHHAIRSPQCARGNQGETRQVLPVLTIRYPGSPRVASHIYVLEITVKGHRAEAEPFLPSTAISHETPALLSRSCDKMLYQWTWRSQAGAWKAPLHLSSLQRQLFTLGLFPVWMPATSCCLLPLLSVVP